MCSSWLRSRSVSIACQKPWWRNDASSPSRAACASAPAPRRFRRLDVAADLGREHEVATVQPGAVSTRLLLESEHARTVQLDRAEAAGRLHGGDGGERTLLAVVVDQRRDVDVGEAVAVGEAEGLVADVAQHALETSAGHRVLAGVHERHLPRLGARAVHFHPLPGRGRRRHRTCAGGSWRSTP